MVSRTVQVDGLLDLVSVKNATIREATIWLNAARDSGMINDVAYQCIAEALRGGDAGAKFAEIVQAAESKSETLVRS